MRKKVIAAFIALLVLLACMAGILLIKPVNLLAHNVWDSFTRQAMSWREGITYLDENPDDVAYLELAIYENKLYVSFPPVPSLAEYPLTFLFGKDTPDYLLLFVYTTLSGLFLTLTVMRRQKPSVAVCFGLLGSAATNLLAITRFGGVWHEAQGLAFLLCSLAAYLITSPKKAAWYWALFCAALAVGCRPFVVFFMPALLWLLYRNLKNQQHSPVHMEQPKAGKLLAQMVPFLILPALVAGGLMWYNWIRFDNPLEFGHNYLPEFMRAENGQFSLAYLADNFGQIFCLPTVNGSIQHFSLFGMQIPYFAFDSQPLTLNMGTANAFYLVNPIIFLYMIYAFRDGGNKLTISNLLFAGGFLLMIFVTCMHKTLGGYQFGARYFLDVIPFLVLYLSTTKLKAGYLEWALCIGGILLNLWGVSILQI